MNSKRLHYRTRSETSYEPPGEGLLGLSRCEERKSDCKIRENKLSNGREGGHWGRYLCFYSNIFFISILFLNLKINKEPTEENHCKKWEVDSKNDFSGLLIFQIKYWNNITIDNLWKRKLEYKLHLSVSEKCYSGYINSLLSLFREKVDYDWVPVDWNPLTDNHYEKYSS